MIDGLISGKLYGQPKKMTGKAGKPFAAAKVRAAAGEGEALFVNVIAFDADTVALTGSLTPKVWTDRQDKACPVGVSIVNKSQQSIST